MVGLDLFTGKATLADLNKKHSTHGSSDHGSDRGSNHQLVIIYFDHHFTICLTHLFMCL